MHYQLCLTMFQESSNNLMVKQGKGKKKENTTEKHACLHLVSFVETHREKLWGKAAGQQQEFLCRKGC